MTQELDRRATGATLRTIGMPDVKELTIPVPPIIEQKTIVELVRVHVTQVDALILEGEKAISLLKERRSALISAAVTGKIDVRGLASSPTQVHS
jgi:type I restriction enzyme S subunit